MRNRQMANVIRIFVEKRNGFDIEARHMLADLRDNLGMTGLRALRFLNRYDVEGLSTSAFGSENTTPRARSNSSVERPSTS